jgi:hypothetical protein
MFKISIAKRDQGHIIQETLRENQNVFYYTSLAEQNKQRLLRRNPRRTTLVAGPQRAIFFISGFAL